MYVHQRHRSKVQLVRVPFQCAMLYEATPMSGEDAGMNSARFDARRVYFNGAERIGGSG